MTHDVAIIEDAGPQKPIGVWFPDLPDCFSAGDDIDEALQNAQEALLLYADSLRREGRALPAPRSLSELRNDPAVAPDLRDHMAALITLQTDAVPAAE
jgi:predicted RNase H-like HicB family nuclease